MIAKCLRFRAGIVSSAILLLNGLSEPRYLFAAALELGRRTSLLSDWYRLALADMAMLR